MGKWLALLGNEIPQTLSSCTDKADERGVLSVLAVAHEEVSENSCLVQFPQTLWSCTDKADKRCADCQHLTRISTCAEPVQAGLLTAAEGFGIVWPPAAHAASCAAFSASTPSKGQERPYRLTLAQGDAAHAEAWDDGAIARFQTRVVRLVRLGFDADDADDLAERLHLRDVEGEDRTLCVECSHYRPGRCGNHRDAGLHTAELARDTAVTLQRCTGFAA